MIGSTVLCWATLFLPLFPPFIHWPQSILSVWKMQVKIHYSIKLFVKNQNFILQATLEERSQGKGRGQPNTHPSGKADPGRNGLVDFPLGALKAPLIWSPSAPSESNKIQPAPVSFNPLNPPPYRPSCTCKG